MVDRGHDAILRAFLAARQARDAELHQVLNDSAQAAAFARLVDHPYLLPLAELVENRCTTLAGARILLENLLATYDEITLNEPLFYGTRVEALAATGVARTELAATLEELCTEEMALKFISAVGRYRCIDNGYGIVPEQALIEEELHQMNSRFLRRVVRVSDGRSPFEGRLLKSLMPRDGADVWWHLGNFSGEKDVIDLREIP